MAMNPVEQLLDAIIEYGPEDDTRGDLRATFEVDAALLDEALALGVDRGQLAEDDTGHYRAVEATP